MSSQPSRDATDACPTCVFRTGQVDLDVSDLAPRYEQKSVLGRGGMGEVRLFNDTRIGRDVAIKLMLPGARGRPDVEARFLREACVQGQLEHPSIVPVHDVGRTKNGEAFFVMKRVLGETLKDVLHRLKSGDEETKKRYPRAKLLSIFQQVCLAIDFAHRRGVIHRDLKPGNLMLGDFGEVYVLDFGIAKLMSESTDVPVSVERHDPKTLDGDFLGTLGYVAPEQLASDEITPQADIYSLGAILFEILTLEPLHPRGTPSEIRGSTLRGADARASLRAPHADVPPELELICVKATQTFARERYASAREMSDAIERYLGGDRDLELRKSLAEAHASSASALLERAVRGDEKSRAEAMREATRAIALDPTNANALGTMLRLLVDVPSELPREARDEQHRLRIEARKTGAKTGVAGTIALFAVSPLLISMGILDGFLAWFCAALVLFSGVLSALTLVSESPPEIYRRGLIVARILLILALARLFGPHLFTPIVAAALLIPPLLYETGRARPVLMALAGAAVIGPGLLEMLGLLPPSHRFVDGMFCHLPQLAAFSEMPTLLLLNVGNLVTIVLGGLLVIHLQRAIARSEDRLRLHSWYLNQLVPK